MIGDDIEVSVLSIMGEKVRIGSGAPQHPVFRKEVYLEISRRRRRRPRPGVERPSRKSEER
jgi:carbon storage regulator